MSRLFIIPGHGAGDSGAIGNGYQEAERVRALATKIKEYGGDNVVLSDFALNSYKSNIIGKGLVPKDCIILELHLDSHTSNTAKGGHVIINGNYKADKYDNALAKMISTMFPGRSKTIVGRTDLANVNRAAQMGYNYRLMECCFISNADDIKKFNANIDELAKKILDCFNIAIKQKPVATKKSNVEIAKEVIQGKWGNGADRKNRLTKAGYNYAEVQAEVDKLLNKTAPAPATIKVGSTVKVKQGAKTYTGGKIASFVYNRKHKVKEIKGDRAVITYLGIVVAAVNIKDLALV